MADRVGPLPFIYNLIKQEIGPTEGLRQYREGGGEIRTQRWFAAYGELQAELYVRPLVQAAPLTRPPTTEEISRVGSTRPGAYLYRGGVLVSVRSVDPLTGTVVETTRTNWASVRSAQLRNYGAVLSELEAKFGTEGSSGQERSSVIGSFVTAVDELVPPDELPA